MSLIALLSEPAAVSRYGLLLAAGLCLYFLFHILLTPRFSAFRRLPSPNQGPIWFRLLHEPKVPEIERWMDELSHRGLFRYHGIFNRERIFVASPEAVKDFLTISPYKFIKPELQWKLANNIAGKGLLIQEGQEHKEARKRNNPTFSPAQMKKCIPGLWKTTVEALEALPTQIQPTTLYRSTADTKPPTGGIISILNLVSAASIDMIGKFGYGVDFATLTNIGPQKSQKSVFSKDPKDKFGRAYLGMFKMTKRGQATLEAASLIGPKIALQLPIPAVRTIAAIMGLVRQTAEDIVVDHEHKLATQDGKGTVGDDMLSLLVNSRHFSHKDLVEQTVHFFAAGTETVASTICWTIHLLSRHPDMQTRLRDEVRANVPSPSAGSPGTMKDTKLHSLKYLNAVVQEVLRFHSINTLLWRECIELATIAGVPIPKGTQIVFSPWALNRDPAYWGPDARSFRPERWLDSPSGGAHHPYSFLTFGGGPRRCIGEQYAREEMLCLVGGLMGRFDFTPIMPGQGTDEGQEIGDNFALTLFKI